MSWSWTPRDFCFRRTRGCSTITDIPLKRCKARELMSDIRGTFIQTVSKEHGANDAADWQVECRLRLKSACAAKMGDRKSTRLNSSHLVISYAVFCLKKKKR